MAPADQTRETYPEAETGDPWDFPTLTPENFNGSPQRRKNPQDPLAVQLSLAEAFKNYDQVLLFLEQDRRLDSILRKLAFHELLNERQLHELSLPDPDKQNPGRFLRFLTAADASALLAGVVILMGADPVGRLLLRLEDSRVQTLLKQSKGFDRPVNSPKSPYTDFYEITRVQLLRSPPPPLRFSPVPTQPMVLRSPPGTPVPAYFSQFSPHDEPLSPSSLKGEIHDVPEIPIQNVPDEASEEQQFPFSVIRDIELSGARVILTRTHTLYRESSSRCFIAFNVVFQPSQDRFRTAEISMTFLPIAGSKQHPVILNIFPNPNQRWSTGPSCDLVSNAKRNINLMVDGDQIRIQLQPHGSWSCHVQAHDFIVRKSRWRRDHLQFCIRRRSGSEDSEQARLLSQLALELAVGESELVPPPSVLYLSGSSIQQAHRARWRRLSLDFVQAHGRLVGSYVLETLHPLLFSHFLIKNTFIKLLD